MVDAYGRRIDYVRISVTDRCNLRCRYCMPEEGIKLFPHDELLSYEEIERAVRIMSRMGFSKVRLTGGEPLVRKDLHILVERLSSIERVRDVSLTTNGTLFYKFAKKLKDAGLRRINISLDSLRKDRFRWITRLGNLDDVLKSIDTAIEMGFHPVKINVVLIRGFNDDEIFDFAKFAMENPVTVRFIEYMPTGGQSFWSVDKVVKNSEVRKLLETRMKLVPSDDDGGGPAQVYAVVGGRGKVGFISPISSHFCSTCNRIRITSDGKVRPCLFSDLEFDIKSPMRRGMGDEEVASVIKEAIKSKPKAHGIFSFSFKKCQRPMTKIGG